MMGICKQREVIAFCSFYVKKLNKVNIKEKFQKSVTGISTNNISQLKQLVALAVVSKGLGDLGKS